ncbi:MAG: hypothetical protein U0X20_18625 [Caldilineaceae bacterium]
MITTTNPPTMSIGRGIEDLLDSRRQHLAELGDAGSGAAGDKVLDRQPGTAADVVAQKAQRFAVVISVLLISMASSMAVSGRRWRRM